ncbi:MAG: ABC transporter substrate-binding protein [Candidatus Krumholzibacteriia bacterium]
MRVPISRSIRTLDPSGGESEEVVTHNVIRQLYEGLVEYDPHTLSVVGRIARSWEASADGREWTFRLEEGVRFLDDPCFPSGRGRAVTSADAKYSIERGIASSRGSGRAGLPQVVGLAQCLAQQSSEIRGIVAASPQVLIVRLERPDPGFLHFLALPPCFIVAREAVERYGPQMRVHPVGTGPFRLASWKAPTGVVLVRNRHYWRTDDSGKRLPYVDALRFVRTDIAAHLYALDTIDVFFSYTRNAPADSLGSLASAESAGWRHYFVPWLNTIYVRFNYRSDHPLVQDRRLREALSCVLPRSNPHDHIPAAGLLPPGLPGHDPQLQGQRTDVSKARRLLEQAGFADRTAIPPLELAWPIWSAWGAGAFAEALRRLGIEAEVRVLETDEFARAIRNNEVDLFRDGWVADYPDPQNFLQLFHSASPKNLGGYSNPRYDRLFEELTRELDENRRQSLARQLERILIEDSTALFIRHERQSQFVSPRVENWEGNCTNPMNIHFYERVSVHTELERVVR